MPLALLRIAEPTVARHMINFRVAIRPNHMAPQAALLAAVGCFGVDVEAAGAGAGVVGVVFAAAGGRSWRGRRSRLSNCHHWSNFVIVAALDSRFRKITHRSVRPAGDDFLWLSLVRLRSRTRAATALRC